jgi:hypothetical protein
MLAVV